MGTGVAESSLASLMVAAPRRKYALGSKRKCSGRSLYYITFAVFWWQAHMRRLKSADFWSWNWSVR